MLTLLLIPRPTGAYRTWILCRKLNWGPYPTGHGLADLREMRKSLEDCECIVVGAAVPVDKIRVRIQYFSDLAKCIQDRPLIVFAILPSCRIYIHRV